MKIKLSFWETIKLNHEITIEGDWTETLERELDNYIDKHYMGANLHDIAEKLKDMGVEVTQVVEDSLDIGEWEWHDTEEVGE